jgi:RimJ/RimL family protein N-acetyltransferase
MRNLLVGERVRLTSIKENDKLLLEEWFNDVEFMRHYDMLPAIPQTVADLDEMINGFKNTANRYLFAIRDKQTGELLGVAGFDEIMWSNGTALVFIGIGNKACRGKGFGNEALGLLLDYGFNELNLYKLQLSVLSYNTAAIKLYEKLGFVREGNYREYILRDGIRHDLYLYGLLKREYETVH